MKSSRSEQQEIDLRELVKRCVDGDRDAFRTLMESEQRYVFVLAYRVLHDEDDANDVVQDAFVRVWNNLAAFDAEMKFTTWLYKIVVNLCYDRLKMRFRRNRVLGYAAGLVHRNDVPDGTDIQRDVERTDLCDRILAAARKLPPMENLVFHLRDVQDLTNEEIAGVAGISVGSVKTNLCYARKRIRAAIAREQEGGE